MMNHKPIIAVDAGGVLVYKTKHGDQTEESRRPMDGAKEGLQKLKDLGYSIYLVSFAGRKTASLNIEDMHNFFPHLLDGQYYVKNKLEKIAICRSIGAVALIDDTWDILETLHKGLYHGTSKEILGMESILGIYFTGDTGTESDDHDKEEKKQTEGTLYPNVNTWSEVVSLCTGLKKSLADGILSDVVPDNMINISKYVYTDLCISPIKPIIPMIGGSVPGNGTKPNNKSSVQKSKNQQPGTKKSNTKNIDGGSNAPSLDVCCPNVTGSDVICSNVKESDIKILFEKQ